MKITVDQSPSLINLRADSSPKTNQKFNISTPPNAENGLICISECANKTLAGGCSSAPFVWGRRCRPTMPSAHTLFSNPNY